ncbi:MAG: hypothetical protein POELPBGB_02939 [Bacteroidia bacterium]|nr:hypothetical protein [Bacteroidia bacterium]
MPEQLNPFDHNYFLGYINQVYPDSVRVHFPSSVLLNKFIFSGEEFNGGLVGNYVTIEGENHGFLGKILELSLPEKERLELSEKAFKNKEFHPTGKIEILLSFDYFDPEKVQKGLNTFPNIGSKVFVSSAGFIQKYFKKFGVKDSEKIPPLFDFGTLTSNNKTSIQVSQQALFGRHCAIIGTTGGGKSWTVSKCLEEIIKNKGKAIILDATGEYASFDGKAKVATPCIVGVDSFFHYTNLSVDDIFVMLRPGGQVQAPKLMEAIKSLKIVKLLPAKVDGTTIIYDGAKSLYTIQLTSTSENILIKNGTIHKESESRRPFNRVYYRFIEEIESVNADFEIDKLPHQLVKECVYEIDKHNTHKWGGTNDIHYNNCTSLILRTNSYIHNPLFKAVFGIGKSKTDTTELTIRIKEFLESDQSVLRIGFEKVGYDFQAREILANAIGKYLLLKARSDAFKSKPIVLFVDEAHQYLNKSVRDEYFEAIQLSAYDQIAKEGRKYGLFLALATQMPRDIPVGTLSQMGTFIVHRLINPKDKEAIENACSTANRNSLVYLPVLGEGEAILMGVDFPMPIVLKVNIPTIPPNSETPRF